MADELMIMQVPLYAQYIATYHYVISVAVHVYI